MNQRLLVSFVIVSIQRTSIHTRVAADQFGRVDL